MRLSDFTPEREFFIGIDSDGCVFDSMEIKHKECFCPAFINHFGLQPVSKYAREVWEFVNLYGKSRGVNRFKAVLQSLELLADRPEVRERGVSVPQLPKLREWVERESKLGNPALEAEVQRTGDEELKRVLAWSHDVNAAVEKIVRNVPPFPYVREFLDAVADRADALVVSQTPGEALAREWAEHTLADKVKLIAGQELGTKSEHLQATAGSAGGAGNQAAARDQAAAAGGGAGSAGAAAGQPGPGDSAGGASGGSSGAGGQPGPGGTGGPGGASGRSAGGTGPQDQPGAPRYAPNHVLMIGDAPGDNKAADSVGALFYPILPGNEEQSWKRLYEESLDRFFAGTYHGAYQQKLLEEFDAALPDSPPWKKGA